MFKKSLLLMLVILAGMFFAGCAGPGQQGTPEGQKPSQEATGQEVIRLRSSESAPESSMHAELARRFASLVEERSNGRVIVETYHAGTLLGIMEMFDGVSEGVSEIGWGLSGMHPGRFGLLDLFDAPVGIPDAQVGTAVLIDMLNEFEHEFFKEYKVIGSYTTATTYLMTRDRIDTLNELNGLEIRVPPPIAPIVEALGAVSVMMPMSEVPEAIEMGIVQGICSNPEVLKDFMFGDTLKFMIEYPFISGVRLIVMDRNYFESMPSDIQQILEEVGLEISLMAGEYIDNYVDEAVAWSISEQNVEIIQLSPEEKVKWDAAVVPYVEHVVDKLEAEGLPAREALERISESL